VIVLSCIIPGQPVPKGRPRAFIVGKGSRRFARFYTPAKTVDAEKALAEQVMLCTGGRALPIQNSVRVMLTFRSGRRPGRGADLDNLVKLVLDALNGVIWSDDRQVVELHAIARPAEGAPCTELRVETAEESEAEEMPGPVEETFG